MYKHTVQYYETDKMGITHHSNYIRWMEEARINYLAEVGFSFDKLEKMGIISPVVSVECAYKKTTTFPETISIDVRVEEFKGVKLKLAYKMFNEDGQLVCEAHSVHCFMDESKKPIALKVKFPEFNAVLIRESQKTQE